jgi:hypothetical protein
LTTSWSTLASTPSSFASSCCNAFFALSCSTLVGEFEDGNSSDTSSS